MPTLINYNQFDSVHWETGSVRNLLAARGFTAPHTGKPYSEAFLLGVSGGITVGYFNFAYKGYDPQCNILTRNTFDPFEKMLSRLGVVQELRHTRSPQKAETILIDALESGTPAIVWPDMWSLPYNGLKYDEGMWGSFPIVVYSYEPEHDVVRIADRARVPLTVSIADLSAARSRIKKDRFRLLTLDAPNPDKLAAAASLGIYDTIQLMTEKPPKGSVNNFGLNALRHWIDMLIRPKQRKSWEKVFPAGTAMYAGLKSAYEFTFLFGKGTLQDAERSMYADFLDEAAILLSKPALNKAAIDYRATAAAWQQLPATLLADDVAAFAETRDLMFKAHRLFIEQGASALDETLAIKSHLAEIRSSMETDFPLSQTEVTAYRERVAYQLEQILSAEEVAVRSLQAAIE
jgi:hypothetical protein